MDSKWRRMAFFMSILMVLMVGAVVFFSNKNLIGTVSQNKTGTAKNNQTDSETVSEEEAAASESFTETVAMQDSLVVSETVTPEDYQAGFAVSDPAKKLGSSLRAFLSDSAFFDQKKSDLQKKMEAEKKNQLSFIITSVDHDMRIIVVDSDNHVVTGVPFVVDVKDSGAYRDDDKDGIIYIGNLQAGKYAVSLEKTTGYTIPEATAVTVKDAVEYTEIPDISLLIKTEAQIVAAQEDTEIQNAREDADKTEITGIQKAGSGKETGIDVSKYNGEIDWNKVRDAGISYVIVRAGYRGSQTGAIVVDPNFQKNMQGALDAGLKVGVYFFTQAVNESEAVEEASAVLELCKSYHLSMPVYLDTEGAGGGGRADSLSADTRTKVCDAFCKTVESAGITAGIYASRNWCGSQLNMDLLQSHSLWLAEYRSAPQYQGYYQMWQYTSKGSVNGIQGNVDLDISYLEEKSNKK